MIQLKISHMINAMARKGYQWMDDKKPYHLNIIGIRSKDLTPNKFNDLLTVSYWDGQDWGFHFFKATTDPGLYWLNNPTNVKGTAILKPGQYINSHRLGKHQGKYDALTQVNPVTVFRDYDRDSDFDFSKEDTGLFGINIHRANPLRESVQVDKWSAGCQVISNPESFKKLMMLAYMSKQKRTNLFTYTLLEEKDFDFVKTI